MPSSIKLERFDQKRYWRNPCGWSKACPRVLWCKSNSVGVLFISHQSIPSGATPKYMTRPRVLGGSFMEREGERGEGKWEGKQREEGGSSPIRESRYKQEWIDYIGWRWEVKSFQLLSFVSSRLQDFRIQCMIWICCIILIRCIIDIVGYVGFVASAGSILDL